ncbi:MAG: rod shape-determining protein MreD [Bacteroidales bacterium]|nr:rod shape-determining protein MreD [Bacteroidales bacterium]
MIKVISRNILRFLMLVLLQVMIFNNIEISGYLNPYIYIIFIILLPFETPAWVCLLLGFFLGLSIDIFTETIGMHTAATVFIAYIRPYILSSFAPRDGYESGTFPRVYYYGLPWFIKYASLLVFAHHLVLFYVEMFQFQDFFSTLLRVILSSLFSITLIVVSQYFVFRK